MYDDVFPYDDTEDIILSEEEQKRVNKLSDKEVLDIEMELANKMSPETAKGLKYFLDSCKVLSKLCKDNKRAKPKDSTIKLNALAKEYLGIEKSDDIVCVKVYVDKRPMLRDWILFNIEKSGLSKVLFKEGRYNGQQGTLVFSKKVSRNDSNCITINGEYVSFKASVVLKIDNMLLILCDNYNCGAANTYEVFMVCDQKYVDESRKKWDEFTVKYNLFKGKFVVVREGNLEIRELKIDIPFNHLVLPKELLDAYSFIANLVKNVDKMEGLGIKHGLLITGDPGVGKTSSLKALMKEHLGLITVFLVEGSIEVYNYHAGDLTIADLYELADSCGPSIVLFEDFDTIAIGDRKHNKDMSQILNLLCGGINYDKVITIATSNAEIKEMDTAVVRPGRFDRHIKVGLPDKTQLVDIIKSHATLSGLDDGEALDVFEGLKVIGRKGMSGAHIASYFKMAMQKAVIEQRKMNKEDLQWAVSRMVLKENVGFSA